MKKLISFSALTKFTALAAAVVAAVGVLLLLVLSGGTAPEFTFANLGWGIALRALVAAILVFGFTSVYFAICYGKNGFKMGLSSGMAAAVSAVCAFAFCIICRAPLSDYTFPVMLFAVVLSYASSAIFFRSYGADKIKGKRMSDKETFEAAANKAFVPMLIALLLIALIAVAIFVVALIYKSKEICIYVLPVIVSSVFSVLFTLSVACWLYAKKV